MTQDKEVNEKRKADLEIANKELTFQNSEKEKRAAELSIANKELNYQNSEKEKRAAELSIANKELNYQNSEKEKRAAELSIANKELNFQNSEKEKRAAELIIANEELNFQNSEKEKRAAELSVANKELHFQNDEKEKRAAELSIANEELNFQNSEKENRAAELSIANVELSFQNSEKEKRAAELSVANKELHFQNNEKESRAAELIIANKELAFQNIEKAKRAAELIIANQELIIQNTEKEKRTAELIIAYRELESFNFISSHDLQEPLRKIQVFSSRMMADEYQNLSDKGKEYLHRIQDAALHMQTLIIDLLEYSRTVSAAGTFENTNIKAIVTDVITSFKSIIHSKKAIIEVEDLCDANVIPSQFRQMIHNLLDNALKFSKPGIPPHIIIKSRIIKAGTGNQLKLIPLREYCHITISDNGIGFESQFKDRIFEMFQRLNNKTLYSGTGIGLAIVKKIVEHHNGVINATGNIDDGANFDIYIPAA